MRTVTFLNMYEALLRREGKDPAADPLTAAQKNVRADILQAAVAKGWRHAWWPDLMTTERRQFAANWASGTAYSSGAQVYYSVSDKYYQALQSSTGQAPASALGVENSAYWAELALSYEAEDYAAATTYAVGDQVFYPTTNLYYQCIAASTGNLPTATAYWGPLTPWVRRIDFDQSWESTEIDDLDLEFGAFETDPRMYGGAGRLTGLTLDETGVLFYDDDTPTRPWLQYRTRPPQFTRTDVVGGTSYAADAVVYYPTTGQCYVCIAATTGSTCPSTTYWALQEVPEFLREFAVREAAAQLLSEDEGRYRAAALAEDELERLYAVQIVDRGLLPRTAGPNG
jgi:hypothetical protein